MFQNALNRHWTYVYFTNGVFYFHVSFLYFNLLIINTFEDWNIRLLCFIFSFNVSLKKNTVGAIKKHCGSDSKTQWERETSPIVFLFFCVKLIPCSYEWVFSLWVIRFHHIESKKTNLITSKIKIETGDWILNTKTETMKLKMKHRNAMFHSFKSLIINVLSRKNETWNKNSGGKKL